MKKANNYDGFRPADYGAFPDTRPAFYVPLELREKIEDACAQVRDQEARRTQAVTSKILTGILILSGTLLLVSFVLAIIK